MTKHNTSRNNHLPHEDKIVFASFFRGIKTMRMVAKELDIDRSNICRYIAEWRKTESIFFVRKGQCKVSKRNGVGYYTTDRMLFEKEKKNNQ